MTQNKSKEFSSIHLSNDDLLKYHRRIFSNDEYRIIENHIANCELCSDALKGVAEMNNVMHIYSIRHELKKRMKKRLTPSRSIFSKFDLLSLMLSFFIVGLILFLAFYFLILKR